MRQWWWVLVVAALLAGAAFLWGVPGGSGLLSGVLSRNSPAPAPPPATSRPAAAESAGVPSAPKEVPKLKPAPYAVTPLPDTVGPDGLPCVHAPAVHAAPPPPAALIGQLGLWVAVIDPKTLQPVRAVAYGPDGVFPLASTYKQAVLWALLKKVDAGQVDLSTTYRVTPAVQSLGAYPYDGMTARALAERMIRNSDNTATDMLHRKAGLGAVQAVADDLHLCHTRFILPTKAWWVTQAGLSPAFKALRAEWPYMHGPEQLRAAERIDADVQKVSADTLQRTLDYYFDHHYDPASDRLSHNLSTPYEFSVLLAHEFLRPGLSPHIQQVQRNIMDMGYGKSALRGFPIAAWGGKGGNGWKILTYTGYIHTKGGEDVVYAFMLHGSPQNYTMPLTYSAFEWIRAGLKQVLLPGDGGGEPASPSAISGQPSVKALGATPVAKGQ